MAVKSADRVLDIFEHLSQFPEGLTAKEISDDLGWAGSSTIGLLKTLSEREYLSVDKKKRYSLGPKLISLGMMAVSMLDICKIAEPILQDTMKTVEETVFLAILSGSELIYIAKVNSKRTISTNVNVGMRKPLYCTGLGKALLAFMDKDKSDKIMDKIQFETFTENTVANKEELKQQLDEFRKQSYAVDNGEIEEELWCVAVPIFNAKGEVIAAMSSAGPKSRMIAKHDLVVNTLKAASSQISRKFGYIQ